MAFALIKKSAFLFAALLILGGLLSGCGRAGAPIKPSQASIQKAKAEKRSTPEAPTANRNAPDKRFILDGLLE